MAAALLLTLIIVVLVKPYTGIRHDSVLYFGQALLLLHPEEFAGDMFFAFGSQAQFTFFPYVMSILLKYVSAEVISLGLTAAGLIAFVAASYLLVSRLVPRPYRYWCLLSVLVMPASYGAPGVFSYAESFLTARSFAEPLVLVGLVFVLRSHWSAAAAVFALAAVTHPLQTAPALLLAWVLIARQHPRAWHLGWLLLPFVGLAAAGVPPFSRFAQAYDSEWLGGVIDAGPHVFMFLWPREAWFSVVADVFVLWVARSMFGRRMRHWIEALLIAGAIGFAASALFADMMHLVLPTGLQFWRIHWLMHWTAMASIPFVVIRLWVKDPTDRVPVVIFCTIAILGAPIGRYGAGIAAAVAIPIFLYWPQLRTSISGWMKKVVLYGFMAASLIAFGKFAVFMIVQSINEPAAASVSIVATLVHPFSLWAMIGLGTYYWYRRPDFSHKTAVALLALLSCLAVNAWDRRSNWSQYVEHAGYGRSPFGVELRPGSQVYWLSEVLTPWLVLRRASYWSGAQEAGLLFNRRTAEEAMRRERIFALVEFQSRVCALLNSLEENPDKCAPDEQAIQTICAEAEGQLDYIVLPQKLKYGVLGKWPIPRLNSLERPVTYYLYQCSDFAASTSAAEQRAR